MKKDFCSCNHNLLTSVTTGEPKENLGIWELGFKIQERDRYKMWIDTIP